jgi:hypothetical protein
VERERENAGIWPGSTSHVELGKFEWMKGGRLEGSNFLEAVDNPARSSPMTWPPCLRSAHARAHAHFISANALSRAKVDALKNKVASMRAWRPACVGHLLATSLLKTAQHHKAQRAEAPRVSAVAAARASPRASRSVVSSPITSCSSFLPTAAIAAQAPAVCPRPDGNGTLEV